MSKFMCHHLKQLIRRNLVLEVKSCMVNLVPVPIGVLWPTSQEALVTFHYIIKSCALYKNNFLVISLH